MRDLIIKDIADENVRYNFLAIQEELSIASMLVAHFKFMEIVVTDTAAVTDRTINHKFGFKPLDVLVTSSIGAGVLTFRYDLFTPSTIIYSTTGPVTVRAFFGRFDLNRRG